MQTFAATVFSIKALTFDKLRVHHLDIHLLLIRCHSGFRVFKVMLFWLIKEVIDVSEDGLIVSNKCGLVDALHLK